MKFRVRIWKSTGDSYRELYYGGSKPRAAWVFESARNTLIETRGNGVIISYEAERDRTERMVDICEVRDGASKFVDAKPEPWGV